MEEMEEMEGKDDKEGCGKDNSTTKKLGWELMIL